MSSLVRLSLFIPIGVSVGSLNGLLISSQAKGEEKSAAGKMKTVWDTIVQGDVFQSWPYVGVVPGLFGKQSLFDNSPLDAYLKKKFVELGGKVVRKISVGIVDAQTGNYINKNESVGNENMPHYIFASASVPAFFPHIIEGDLVLIDGGTTDNMNLRNGIARCREIVGDDDEAITIDVLMSNPCTLSYVIICS